MSHPCSSPSGLLSPSEYSQVKWTFFNTLATLYPNVHPKIHPIIIIIHPKIW